MFVCCVMHIYSWHRNAVQFLQLSSHLYSVTMGTINQYFLYLIIILWQSLKLLKVKAGYMTFPTLCDDKGQFILKEGKVNKMI